MTLAAGRPSRLLVVAGAGYGKSALLEADRPEGGVVRAATDVRHRGLPPGIPWVGVDDFDELTTDGQADVLRMLTAGPDLGFGIASRTPIPAQVRSSLRVQVHDRGPVDLALAAYRIVALLAEEYSVTDPEAAVAVRDLTAGWAALVHFAGDALRRDPGVDLAAALSQPGSAAAIWIASNVLGGLPPEVLAVLGVLAGLGPVSQRCWDAVAIASGSHLAQPPGVVESLRQIGLLVPRRAAGTTDELVVVPAVSAVLAQLRGGTTQDTTALLAAAAAHESEGDWFPAAQAHALAGQARAAARLVTDHGEAMLRGGQAVGVVALLDGQDPVDGPESLQRIHADALRMSGELAAARRAFDPLARRADRQGWSAALATRVASLHYSRGDFADALEVLDRVSVAPAEACVEDEVGWLARRVDVLWMLGRTTEAGLDAARALDRAARSGSTDALALGHLAAARTSTGALREAHHHDALRAALTTGDAVTAARVMSAQTHLLLASARYREACVIAREALRMAELSSPTGLRAVTLHNLGEALTRVGEFDEAKWHLDRSIVHCRRLGPGRTAMGLLGLAEIHRELHHEEQGRAAYLEAVALARDSGDLQVLVPALAGLARLTVELSPDAARSAATEAEQIATPDLLPVAMTARGWVALARGDLIEAAQHAARGVASARAAQTVDLLAEALELAGESAGDPRDARIALQEALSLWDEGGAAPAVARVEVLLGRLPGADGADRSRAREAGRKLQRLGILRVHGHPVTADRGAAAAVAIDVLGPFRVSVNQMEVPLPAWRSRQARTLVKILAARRGRVVTRGRLCELLWPDDDPARTGHRLSVLLATVRGVLDPGKCWPPDRYIAAGQTGVRLDLSRVALDADALIRDAAYAAELVEAGDGDRAREILTSIDTRYGGDAFEDEPAEQWADGLREEARSAWVRSVRSLALLHGRAGRGGEAVGLLMRLLIVDPYDERVHRRLVTSLSRSGRHGEARRAFERWVEAMSAIDAPLPDAAVLGVVQAPAHGPSVLIP
ncbi:MAG: hypothetical protein L0H79_05445 [Intrasporangium sp.]|uniref:BTAD domain-containing putative transcriptional regulator n=1 Tax=Intrasporangium sp. TaxID=1925024 RepID=UPI0026498B35|nr:BTAD domain-containing putative transcriptional regulator [Intrasporangium sp.]MDN5795181.1 hypothetical protein [Intrasporangium sp.]